MRYSSLLILAALIAGGCERERRDFAGTHAPPRASAVVPRQSPLQPAAAQSNPVAAAGAGGQRYEENAYAVSQGKRLYRWYNCNGCHAGGGGGIGPALTDGEWIYGGTSAEVFMSIMQGRPNGMPSFGGHIPEDQAWQLAAYVRSMSGQLKKDVAPGRSDTLQAAPPESGRDKETPQGRAHQPSPRKEQ